MIYPHNTHLSQYVTRNKPKTSSPEEHQEPLFQKSINLPIVTVLILMQEYVTDDKSSPSPTDSSPEQSSVRIIPLLIILMIFKAMEDIQYFFPDFIDDPCLSCNILYMIWDAIFQVTTGWEGLYFLKM